MRSNIYHIFIIVSLGAIVSSVVARDINMLDSTSYPTGRPTSEPSNRPTQFPTGEPTGYPSKVFVYAPDSVAPSPVPTLPWESWVQFTSVPTRMPTYVPTTWPTQRPTEFPTSTPTQEPTDAEEEDTEGIFFTFSRQSLIMKAAIIGALFVFPLAIGGGYLYYKYNILKQNIQPQNKPSDTRTKGPPYSPHFNSEFRPPAYNPFGSLSFVTTEDDVASAHSITSETAVLNPKAMGTDERVRGDPHAYTYKGKPNFFVV